MKLKSKPVVASLISLIAAIMMIVSALWFKDTQYENAWLYIFVGWAVTIAVIEISCFRKK